MFAELTLICIALNVYFEARGDSMASKVAVAQAVLVRMEDPRYPDDACGVVYQHKQFSWYWDGKSDKPREQHAWEEAQLIASAVLAGSGHADFSATHYHAEYVSPYWAQLYVFVGQHGRHLFYERRDDS